MGGTVAKWSQGLLVREIKPKNKKIIRLPWTWAIFKKSSEALEHCCSVIVATYLTTGVNKQTWQVNNQTKRIIRIHFINGAQKINLILFRLRLNFKSKWAAKQLRERWIFSSPPS